jgi:tetratricopeptide (TPR) repeat protein
VLAFFASKLISDQDQAKPASFSQFLTQLDEGKIRDVTLRTKDNSMEVRLDQTEKAVQSYREATRLNTDYAVAFLRLGALYARLKNLPGASAALDRAEALYGAVGDQEGRAEVLYQRGRLYLELGRTAEAQRELEQSLELARANGNRPQEVQALSQLSAAALKTGNRAQGLAYAREASEMAQAGGMYNLAARSFVTLGNLAFTWGDHAEAERLYNRALDFARNHKLRPVEAMALFSLGSMYQKQSRLDEAVRALTPALDFYRQGRYRKEADRATLLVARLKRQQGDYAGALSTLEPQLQLAQQDGGDMGLLGNLHRECGAVLLYREHYTEALRHFDESHKIFKSLGDPSLIGYNHIVRASALWRLGRYDEARDALAEAREIADGPRGSHKELLWNVNLTESQAALSRLRPADAMDKGRQALAIAREIGAQAGDLVAEADLALCLAEVASGAPPRARAFCEEGVRLAEQTKDPWYVSTARLALAEALLAAGDAQGAREAALGAHEFFARSGRVDSEWRALVVAGLASRRAGDEALAREQFARAAASLARLGEVWGAEALPGYLARPDVQTLRRELGGLTSAALN